MNVKLTFNIEIDESKFKNLKKSEIRKIIKEMEVNGSIVDYIYSEINSSLETEDFDK